VAHERDAAAIELGKGVGADLYGMDYRPCPVDIKLKGNEEDFAWSGGHLKIVHIPGHTPGSVAAYVDLGKRVLFGQDIHGPYYTRWGADPKQAVASLQRLVELRADILCEGHFGIYQPASQVETYIKGFLNGLRQGDIDEDFQGVY
jgi:glyoxylase-like metal-dependent hydrolase (beta-lactamase superfamily II)